MHAQKEDGILLPDRAKIFLSAIEDEAYKADKVECTSTRARVCACVFAPVCILGWTGTT